ncbi:MAG: UDP-N-acetylglucosamine 1-carboxyvinyltransferase [Anaerolineae bacterium]|nr:UDP-N-acetylglucosamine 1-carboxyvinyltransferase [Anaerolineae bacterium]
MAKLVINGGYPLKGEVTPSGNKNAAQPILAATLLTDQPVTVSNLPDILDVRTVLDLLEDVGASVERHDPHTVTVCAAGVNKTRLELEAARTIRGSILFAGPLLARFGRATVCVPGGCAIGRRGVGTHMRAFEALGARVRVNGGYEMHADRLRGADVLLDEASVTGTENAIMAACLAEGHTTLRNAASEPHVQDLCHFLNSLGARITGVGSNVLHIEGVSQLGGGQCRIASDHTEVGSFIGLAAVTRGELRIRDAVPEHMRMTRLVFDRLGVRTEVDGGDIVVPADQELRVEAAFDGNVPKIDDGVWPAFPSDMMSVALLVATQCRGTVLFWEKMFESRMFFVDRLIAMGASIILCDPHRAVVVGPSALHGEELQSPDIRAGVALLGAALCARGRSTIGNIGQIDRGYERIDEKLRALGAHIQRVEE